MRKACMAVAVALVIGMALRPAETAAMAGQGGGGAGAGILVGKEGMLSGQIPDVTVSGNLWKDGGEGMLSLQIPQKLEVIIDPWELDGKGQIYSEQYVVQNMGDATGTLTLSFLCRPQENSGAIVRQEKEGLHNDGNKSVYIEMVLGDGNEIILSQERTEYQAKLKPGERLSICFTGEVNENAPGQWRDGSIVIEGSYLWEIEEEALADADGAEGGNGSMDDGTGELGKKPTASGNDVLGDDPAEKDYPDSESNGGFQITEATEDSRTVESSSEGNWEE